MFAISTLRGHKIYINGDNEWAYCDNAQPTITSYKSRPCNHCGEFSTTEGHDSCWEQLNGVKNACCGHGDPSAAYIHFEGGLVVRGFAAKQAGDILKRAQ